MVKYRSTKLACYIGFVVQSVVNNFLPILFIIFQKNYGLNYEMLGRTILVNFGVQFVTDALTPKIVKILGYRNAIIMSQFGASIGLIMLAVLPNIMSNTYLAIILSIIVYASSSGLIEVLLSPLMEALPFENKKANMAVMHSFYCWGQIFTVVITTLLVKALGYGNWTYIPIVWAIIPFINAVGFMRVPIVEPISQEKSTPLKNLFKDKTFLRIMVMMFCGGAAEIAMAEWASMFAQEGLGVSKIIGDFAGPCAFALFMGSGRIAYAVFSNKISFKKAVITMCIACMFCYVLTGLIQSPVGALTTCALCGFTVSIFWPGTYSAGAAIFSRGGTKMFSVLALCGDLGCAIGPWILGVVADAVGLRYGFIICGIFPLVMLLAATKINFKEKRL